MNEEPANPPISGGQHKDTGDVSSAESQHQLSGKRKPLLLVLVGLLVVGLLAGIYFWVSKEPKPVVVKRTVKVGLLAPLAGDNVNVGLSMKEAVQLAIKDLNLEGTTIQLVERDSGCQADKAKVAAEELITKEKVVAIIGDNCSGATLAASTLATQYKVPMISPASTSPRLTTEAGDYVFRTIPSDAGQGVFAADLISKAGLKRLGVLYSNEPYGQGLAEVVKAQFEKDGGTVVAYEAVEREATDVSAAIGKIKAAKPDSLYIVSGAAAQNAASLLAVKAAGLSVKLYGAEGFTDKTILNDAADAAEGLTVTAVAEGSESFIAKYKAAYNTTPGVYTAQAYDAFAAIGEALKAGANTGEEIKNALYKVDFQGASGHVKFDKNGDPVEGKYSVFTVKDRQLVAVPQ